jgi:hypothetical protein
MGGQEMKMIKLIASVVGRRTMHVLWVAVNMMQMSPAHASPGCSGLTGVDFQMTPLQPLTPFFADVFYRDDLIEFLPSGGIQVLFQFDDVTMATTSNAIVPAQGLTLISASNSANAPGSVLFKCFPTRDPVVTAITPTTGPAIGGTSVIITGVNFSEFSPIMGVTFGSSPAAFSVTGDTSITATSPAGAGVVDVIVQAQGGPSSAPSISDRFSYGPAITAIAPSRGPSVGGTGVTLTGTSFGSASTVSFGATAATNVNVISGTSITATSPAGTGIKDVTVTTVFGTSAISATDEFMYVPATHDFNGDGYSDIAWLDGNGDVAFWLMNGAAISSSGGVSGLPSTWSIVGQRDFNGDGMADLLWHDTSGNTAIWFMNGVTVSSTTGVGNIPTAWSVIGTGDFNGDGFGDIIWRDTSGNVAVWLMNGGTISSSAGLGNVPLAWNIVGTGDYNGDGKADILWRDTSGNIAIWFMNGVTIASSAAVGNLATTWSVVGTGDFNADGKSDIVWRDTAGDTAIWLMNGAAVSSGGGLGNPGSTWSIVQTGDYNSDGMSDLLWRDTSGNTFMWFMNGAAVSSAAFVGNIPTNWTVQSVNAE